MQGSKLSAPRLREVLGHWPTGVAVVTALSESGEPSGMVVGSFSSVSLDPPLVSFFATRNSSSFAAIRSAGVFCANVLSADQEDLCRQFSRPGPDKFAGVPWHQAPTGSPILHGGLAWVDCTVESVAEAGDHFAMFGRVVHLSHVRYDSPLIFHRGAFGRLLPVARDARTST